MSTFRRDCVAPIFVRVASNNQPCIRRHCPRCATERRFVSSGKFRVNAQRKTIDAWLIFLCTECDGRWNLPIHERRPVKAIEPAELEALMRNDATLADRLAATAGGRVPEIGVAVSFDACAGRDAPEIEFQLAVAPHCAIRLDRLLAMILGLKRAEIQTLADASVLHVAPPAPKALRRAAIDRQAVRLDLSRCPAEFAMRCRAHLATWPLSNPAPDRPG